MNLTTILLVVGAVLFVGATALATAGVKKSPLTAYADAGLKLIAVLMLAIGIGRTGYGVSYKTANTVVAKLQEAQVVEQQRQQEEASKNVRKHLRDQADDIAKWAPVLGDEKAPAGKTIYVWSAADCPYCIKLHAELERVLAARKDVRVVIKNFPVHGEITDIPGRWTIAAKIQSNAKAAKLYEKIMAKPYWNESNRGDMKTVTANMKKYAGEVGLDVAQAEKDLNGTTVTQEMNQVRELAQKFNISGTPYLIIGEQIFAGMIPYEAILNALEQ